MAHVVHYQFQPSAWRLPFLTERDKHRMSPFLDRMERESVSDFSKFISTLIPFYYELVRQYSHEKDAEVWRLLANIKVAMLHTEYKLHGFKDYAPFPEFATLMVPSLVVNDICNLPHTSHWGDDPVPGLPTFGPPPHRLFSSQGSRFPNASYEEPERPVSVRFVYHSAVPRGSPPVVMFADPIPLGGDYCDVIVTGFPQSYVDNYIPVPLPRDVPFVSTVQTSVLAGGLPCPDFTVPYSSGEKIIMSPTSLVNWVLPDNVDIPSAPATIKSADGSVPHFLVPDCLYHLDVGQRVFSAAVLSPGVDPRCDRGSSSLSPEGFLYKADKHVAQTFSDVPGKVFSVSSGMCFAISPCQGARCSRSYSFLGPSSLVPMILSYFTTHECYLAFNVDYGAYSSPLFLAPGTASVYVSRVWTVPSPPPD